MSNKYYYIFSDKHCKEKMEMRKQYSHFSVVRKVLVDGNWKYYTDQVSEDALSSYLKRYSDGKVILISDNAKTC